jgi:hypothetical protein
MPSERFSKSRNDAVGVVNAFFMIGCSQIRNWGPRTRLLRDFTGSWHERIVPAGRQERAGGYGPALSGTGSPLLDCDADGRYNPFRTAQRKAFAEATGPLLPDLSWITFFGLARTFKPRLWFLFGELR